MKKINTGKRSVSALAYSIHKANQSISEEQVDKHATSDTAVVSGNDPKNDAKASK